MSDRLPAVPTVAIEVERDPEEVIAAATRAAKALERVLANKRKKVVINGEQYLEFEDWQTLGQFYGYTVRTLEAKPIEIGGAVGAYARAELIEIRTGEIIGGADAYCMRDEDRWDKRPWFQLASMAQTRAGAKALRNRLAWVAVLAGYKPTPAEEMQEGEFREEPKQEHFCPIHNVPFQKRTGKDGQSWYSHKMDDGNYCNERNVTGGNGEKPTPPPQSQRPAAPKADPERDELKKRWADLWNQAMDLKMKPTVTLNPTSASIDEMRAAVKQLADEIAAFTELKQQGKLV